MSSGNEEIADSQVNPAPCSWTTVEKPGKKRKNRCSGSSPKDKDTKDAKIRVNDNQCSGFVNSLTCEQTGYSNYGVSKGLHSSSTEENERQVSQTSNRSDTDCLITNKLFDDCNSYNKSGADPDGRKVEKNLMEEFRALSNVAMNESSMVNRSCEKPNHEKSWANKSVYTDPEIECDSDIEIEPADTWVSGPFCNTNPDSPISITDAPKLTDLVKTLFTPKTAESLVGTIDDLATPFSKSTILSDQPPTYSESDQDSMTKENNMYLKEMAQSGKVTMTFLKSIHTTVSKNASELTKVKKGLRYLEGFVDKTITSFSHRLDSQERQLSDLTDRFPALSSKMHDYIDKRVESITGAFPDTLAKLGKEVDEKFLLNIEKTKSIIDQRVENLPGLEGMKEVCDNAIKQCVNERLIPKYSDFESLSRKLTDLNLSNDNGNNEAIRKLQSDVNNLKLKNAALEAELAKCNTNKTAPDPSSHINDQNKQLWESFKSKTEATLAAIPGMKVDLEEYGKKVQSLDTKSRRLNIIIDQLEESNNEDTLALINGILDHALSIADRPQVDIVRAFRLGQKTLDGPPRKILIELSSPKGREIIMANARNITRAGNNGRNYFINEDLPDAVRRHKNDMYKYVKYLGERRHTASRIGDDILLDGKRYKYSELNTLPIGLRLMDSRTIFNRGVVAFQSSISPLSNLFPCTLHYNGATYSSLEQCFQYHKAIHHNRNELASDIMKTKDPYTAMSLGKSITNIDRDWENTRLGIMELMLRHKLDQCTTFRELLRFTGQHHLAENSWNRFWGTGSSFCGDQVWYGNFPGANNLGRLLETVRCSI